MAKCPDCKKEIGKLLSSAKLEHEEVFQNGDWFDEPQLYQDSEYHCFCPECDNEIELFDPEKFLKGKEEQAELSACLCSRQGGDFMNN